VKSQYSKQLNHQKMKYTILLLFLSHLAPAQQTNIVISNNGLKLRESPCQSGRVLAVAPFGAKVQVMTHDTGKYGSRKYEPLAKRDTIGTVAVTSHSNKPMPHVGYWWQVQYQGKSGYMFSGFLADSALLFHRYMPEINDNFRLRMPGGNAGGTNNPEFDSDWLWYGVFQQAPGEFSLKQVKLRYAVADYADGNGVYDFLDREIVLFTDGPMQPAVLIGSKKPMKERSSMQGFWEDGKVLDRQFTGLDATPNTAFFNKYQLEVNKVQADNQETLEWSMLSPNGTKQAVPPLKISEYSDRDFKLPPSYLLLACDLDGDGKLDYVFGAYGEMGYNALYLSSQVGKGGVAKPVAVLYDWYTC